MKKKLEKKLENLSNSALIEYVGNLTIAEFEALPAKDKQLFYDALDDKYFEDYAARAEF